MLRWQCQKLSRKRVHIFFACFFQIPIPVSIKCNHIRYVANFSLYSQAEHCTLGHIISLWKALSVDFGKKMIKNGQVSDVQLLNT